MRITQDFISTFEVEVKLVLSWVDGVRDQKEHRINERIIDAEQEFGTIEWQLEQC